MKELVEKIFQIKNNLEFEVVALEVFHYQYENNSVYREFVNAINTKKSEVTSISDIPFLPIEFFKSHKVACENRKTEIIFTSSGTTGTNTSKHFVSSVEMYKTSFSKSFNYFYGDISEYCVIALLPSYKEREGSSLIFMVDDFISKSNHALSGYYLKADKKLYDVLKQLSDTNSKTIVVGVTYALLDFAEQFNMELKNCIVMETGGMKGKRKEIVRDELHKTLQKSFGVSKIHSEYGMTELLSQAYSKGDGIFYCPPWMRVGAREIDDPLSPVLTQKTGGLNVIDLANLHSCSFIATQDLCKINPDNSFEILGRFDNSDIRGCNLLL